MNFLQSWESPKSRENQIFAPIRDKSKIILQIVSFDPRMDYVESITKSGHVFPTYVILSDSGQLGAKRQQARLLCGPHKGPEFVDDGLGFRVD